MSCVVEEIRDIVLKRETHLYFFKFLMLSTTNTRQSLLNLIPNVKIAIKDRGSAIEQA